MNFNSRTDIPSLTDKVILITGGTDGLGKESLQQLSTRSPAHIYLACRNKTKADKVLSELAQTHPNHAPVTIIEMDLSSLASVKAAATSFLSQSTRLDILMCNAGAAGSPSLTHDGYEQTFGLNHIGHALLIQLLLPILRHTASLPASDVRVVTLSSLAEKFAPKQYLFDQMRTTQSHITTFTRYAQAKLANIHYTQSLAQRYPEILWVSVHPGAVRTNFENNSDILGDQPIVGALVHAIGPWFIKVVDVHEGAWGQLWAATGKREGIENGGFYWPVAKAGKGSAKTKDAKMAEELWYWTEKELRPYLEVDA